MSRGLWIQRFRALSWQPLFGALDQMPPSWVLPRRHLAQRSEKLPESPASTERAAQLAQILAVLQPEQREVNPRDPWEVGCAQWCRRPGIEGLTSWLLFGTGAVSFEEMEPQRTLTVRWSAPLWWWLVQDLQRSLQGYCPFHVETGGLKGDPRPGLLISNSADAEENAKYLKNFLIFFRILSNQSTNFFF